MSRRLRARAAAIEAKHAPVYGSGPEDDTEDEGGIDARDDDPRCYVCGERESVTDSGCCGIGGERSECPRW